MSIYALLLHMGIELDPASDASCDADSESIDGGRAPMPPERPGLPAAPEPAPETLPSPGDRTGA